MVAIPNQLNIYIPKPDSYLATRIKVGSGIVGSIEGDGVCIDYEGNLYGADNVRTYADRVMHAADRHLWRYPNRYPTIARMHLRDEVNDLICIGWFHPASGLLTISVDPEVCAHWVDLSDPAQLKMTDSYAPRQPGIHP